MTCTLCNHQTQQNDYVSREVSYLTVGNFLDITGSIINYQIIVSTNELFSIYGYVYSEIN